MKMRSHPMRWGGACVAAMLLAANSAVAEVLLEETWKDGSRAETRLPAESAAWLGRKNDVAVEAGALITKMTPASQKIWTYFTDKDPVALAVGQKLTASVTFIPRGALREGTSRGFRIGLFYDDNSPRVAADLNSDGGGPELPWKDAKGYAVQVLVSGGEYSSTKPFDLGKRVNLESKSLLGTSGDYAKASGGEPVALELDKEYTVTLEVERSSENEVTLTATYWQSGEKLSSWTVVDDGSYLGSEPVCDKFDLLYIRLSDSTTTADEIAFKNLKVERSESK